MRRLSPPNSDKLKKINMRFMRFKNSIEINLLSTDFPFKSKGNARVPIQIKLLSIDLFKIHRISKDFN